MEEQQKCSKFDIAVFHSQLWALSWEWDNIVINWIQFHIDKTDSIKINLLAQKGNFHCLFPITHEWTQSIFTLINKFSKWHPLCSPLTLPSEEPFCSFIHPETIRKPIIFYYHAEFYAFSVYHPLKPHHHEH